MEIALLVWLVFAVVGGAIGAIKGRVGEGVLLGLFLGPLGILIVPALKSQKELDRKNTRKCPFCAERVANDAKLCKHCGQSFLVPFACPACSGNLMKPIDAISGTPMKCTQCATIIVIP